MKTNSEIKNPGLKNRSEQLSTEKEMADSASAPRVRTDNWLPVDIDQRKYNRSLPASQILLTRLPDTYGLAEVVGKWVWVQFREVPAAEIRQRLSELGFHWNRARQAWQHPCGVNRHESASFDPRNKYCSYFLADVNPV